MKIVYYLTWLAIFLIPIESSVAGIIEGYEGVVPGTLVGYILFVVSLPFILKNWDMIYKEFMLLSGVIGLGTISAFISGYGYNRQLTTLWQMLYFYLVILLLSKKNNKRTGLILSYLSGWSIACLMILYQYYISESYSFVAISRSFFTRAVGLIGVDSNVVGLMAALSIGYLISLSIEKSKSFYFTLAAVLMALSFWVLFITSSKGGMVATAAGLLAYIMIQEKAKVSFYKKLKLCILIMFAFMLLIIVIDYISDLLSFAHFRWTTAKNISELTSKRIDILTLALSYVPKYPFGIGIGNSQYLLGYNSIIHLFDRLDAHNQYLKFLLEYGWLGFVFFGKLFYDTIASSFKESKSGTLWPFVCMIVLTVGMTTLSLDNKKFFWFVLAISKYNYQINSN